MFKIINGVLVSALILIVSIACSSAPPITVDEYNKLLNRISALETENLARSMDNIILCVSIKETLMSLHDTQTHEAIIEKTCK